VKRSFFPLVLALAGILAASPVAGQQKKAPQLPAGLPPYGPPVPFHAPTVAVHQLPNGMTVWLVSRSDIPKVAISMAIRGGRAADPTGRPGLSNLLASTLTQGTTNRSAVQIAREIQADGGDLSARASADAILVSTGVLSTHADSALALIADVCRNATFPEDEVALAKRNAADDLRGNEASPEFLASRALAKAVFGNHPYSVIAPTQASITATTAAELRSEYARRFRPDQTLLVAVGSFDSSDFLAAIDKDFGSWKAPGTARVSEPPAAGENPHAIFLVPRAGSVQTTLALGALGPTESSPEYAAARVANAIYGGMFGSRLVNNIREDKGYTYSSGSFLQGYRDAGLLETFAPVRNAVTGAALNEIVYELNRMATTEPTTEELSHAQHYLVGTTSLSLQSQDGLAGRLSRNWILGLPPDAISKSVEAIEQVTPGQVAAAGRKYFYAARETIVAVGEANVVREQVAPFGLPIHDVH
jgi:zinc protease